MPGFDSANANVYINSLIRIVICTSLGLVFLLVAFGPESIGLTCGSMFGLRPLTRLRHILNDEAFID